MMMQTLVCDANAGAMLTLMLIALYSAGGTRVMHACDDVMDDAMQ